MRALIVPMTPSSSSSDASASSAARNAWVFARAAGSADGLLADAATPPAPVAPLPPPGAQLLRAVGLSGGDVSFFVPMRSSLSESVAPSSSMSEQSSIASSAFVLGGGCTNAGAAGFGMALRAARGALPEAALLLFGGLASLGEPRLMLPELRLPGLSGISFGCSSCCAFFMNASRPPPPRRPLLASSFFINASKPPPPPPPPPSLAALSSPSPHSPPPPTFRAMSLSVSSLSASSACTTRRASKCMSSGGGACDARGGGQQQAKSIVGRVGVCE